jgi:hypothetical protein
MVKQMLRQLLQRPTPFLTMPTHCLLRSHRLLHDVVLQNVHRRKHSTTFALTVILQIFQIKPPCPSMLHLVVFVERKIVFTLFAAHQTFGRNCRMNVAMMIERLLARQHLAAFGHATLETRFGVDLFDVVIETRRKLKRRLTVLAFVLANLVTGVCGHVLVQLALLVVAVATDFTMEFESF